MSENNLPSNKVKSNGVFKKIRNWFAVGLAAIGIITPTAKAADNTQETAQDDSKNTSSIQKQDISQEERYEEVLTGLGVEQVATDKFREGLQEATIDNSVTDKMIVDKNITDKTIQDTNSKIPEVTDISKAGLENILASKGFGQKENEIILKCWDKIELCYDKNNEFENYEYTKEEFKKIFLESILNNVENFNHTVLYSGENAVKNDKNAKILEENNFIGVCINSKDIIVGSRYIPGITGSDENELSSGYVNDYDNEGIFLHELAHTDNTKTISDTNIINQTRLTRALAEGNSVFVQGKIRENTQGAVQSYPFETSLYRKFNYLFGEKRMQDLISGKENLNYAELFESEIAPKYGKELSDKLLQDVVNVSRHCVEYMPNTSIDIEKESVQANNKMNKEIIENYENFEGKYENPIYIETMELYSKEDTTEELKRLIELQLPQIPKYLDITKDTYNNALANLKLGENYYKSLDKTRGELFNELEADILTCMQKDINGIETKKEASDALRMWESYRINSLTNNDELTNEWLCDTIDSQKCSPGIRKVTDALYDKCLENGLINVESKDAFNLLIELPLESIETANVKIDGSKVYVIDNDNLLVYDVHDGKAERDYETEFSKGDDILSQDGFTNFIKQDVPAKDIIEKGDGEDVSR